MPIIKAGELDIISHSTEQTQRLGVKLGAVLQPGDIVCLSGDMGAGKTVFATGMGIGWGANHPLTSPTFNLVHEHSREADDGHLYHLDCYRLADADETESIGLEDMLEGDGIMVFEWPEHIEAALPKKRLWIEIRIIEPTRRNFIFEGHGQRYEQRVAEFRKKTYGR